MSCWVQHMRQTSNKRQRQERPWKQARADWIEGELCHNCGNRLAAEIHEIARGVSSRPIAYADPDTWLRTCRECHDGPLSESSKEAIKRQILKKFDAVCAAVCNAKGWADDGDYFGRCFGSKGMTYRNEKGQPFSKWKPAEKFEFVFARDFPEYWSYHMPEYQFDITRSWRMDYAWPDVFVSVEIDGFGWGHQAQQHLAANHEKQNAAMLQGWRVLRYCSRQLGSMAGVEDAVEEAVRLMADAG